MKQDQKLVSVVSSRQLSQIGGFGVPKELLVQATPAATTESDDETKQNTTLNQTTGENEGGEYVPEIDHNLCADNILPDILTSYTDLPRKSSAHPFVEEEEGNLDNPEVHHIYNIYE